MSLQATKLTYDDYRLIPDDGLRHEIIDGEHYVNPAPAPIHQIVLMHISGLLWQYTLEHGGTVMPAPCDVILSDGDVLQPDIVYVAPGHEHAITGRGVEAAPDLVVEILSERTRKLDETYKLKRYSLFGVTEYWIVDVVKKLVRIYRRQDDALRLDVTTTAPFTTPLLPQLVIDLARPFSADLKA
jgi:Uma2 family endonuclease